MFTNHGVGVGFGVAVGLGAGVGGDGGGVGDGVGVGEGVGVDGGVVGGKTACAFTLGPGSGVEDPVGNPAGAGLVTLCTPVAFGGSGVADAINSETVTNLKCFAASCSSVEGIASTVPR